jgi:NAD(P)-dependent dehydrogenase (short-subunit alcohol dehydrogenase family)
VTGSAYGIGRGIARHFAARQTAVLIADINQERGKEVESAILATGGQALFVLTDVIEEDSVRRMVERCIAEWGRIDVLCNNAGIERYNPAADYAREDWDAIVHTNLRGAFLCSKYALPHLIKTKGSIINIASVQAIACESNISVYASSKAGLLAFTRGAALDYARHGVRVNAICPGAIHTGMMEDFLATQSDPEKALSAAANAIPLGRVGQPEDIAPLVYFLASQEASYITGGTFVVDGGVLARLAL